jgi:hypothetical protein
MLPRTRKSSSAQWNHAHGWQRERTPFAALVERLSSGEMTTRNELRAYLDRPWARLRALKDRHNAQTVEREGADRAFAIAIGLSVRAAEAGALPTDAERADDLAVAVRIRSLLDRAGRRHRHAR